IARQLAEVLAKLEGNAGLEHCARAAFAEDRLTIDVESHVYPVVHHRASVKMSVDYVMYAVGIATIAALIGTAEICIAWVFVPAVKGARHADQIWNPGLAPLRFDSQCKRSKH